MIKFENVSRGYKNGSFSLKNINLEIKEGEFMFLVGPSGAGKTSLVRIMTKEDVPTEGVITVDDENVNKMRGGRVPYLRRKIGVVFQDFKLLQYRDVFDNVSIAMEVAGKKKSEIDEVVPRILKLVGLEDKAGYYPDQLAGGEQQRVSIARTLAHDPKYLVADEPTGNIDPKATWEVAQIFQKINKFGTTVIFATHDKEIVNSLKKRVVSLDNGEIVKDEIDSLYE